jgi:hypothetical protein
MISLSKSYASLRPCSVFWLVPAILVLPAFFGIALVEEDNLPNAFQSLSTSAIVWFPCLALIAALTGRFQAFHATGATVMFAVYDTVRVREILYDWIGRLIDLSGNPNWITLGALVGPAAILLIATLVRTTLYRLVVLVACMAQIVTLTIFHVVTVTEPISVAGENEREFVAEVVGRDGNLDVLCGIQKRSCFKGRPLELASHLEQRLLNPGSLTRILRDEAASEMVLFTWTESAFASTADEAMRHITVFKPSRDEAAVMINEEAPTKAFGAMKIAFSILAGCFQQSWMFLSLMIVWRHRDYEWKGRKWRRMP